MKLADEFATAARLYADAVVRLTTANIMPQAQYERCREAAEVAGIRVAQASTAFGEHVSLHHCAAIPAARGSQAG